MTGSLQIPWYTSFGALTTLSVFCRLGRAPILRGHNCAHRIHTVDMVACDCRTFAVVTSVRLAAATAKYSRRWSPPPPDGMHLEDEETIATAHPKSCCSSCCEQTRTRNCCLRL
ncbi:hypothetical protein B0H17DRAFT_1140873 [Mycena rosella]|uniref:Uncharacterized protein n=1 Tax=Mycena rosella TaxID=1033263 RepID=A0AAD7GBI5_MYCRO|nr:hypothetical protein B0H17DRAFT_1140873 [Mycena rosella]